MHNGYYIATISIPIAKVFSVISMHAVSGFRPNLQRYCRLPPRQCRMEGNEVLDRSLRSLRLARKT